MQLYDLYKQNQELTKSQQDYEKALSATIAKTTEYAAVVIQPAEALARMNDEERKAYRESLRLAEQHYRAQSELISRRDAQKGNTSRVSDEAMAAFRTARDYQRAQQQIEDAQAEREAAEQRHGETIAKIKADELAKVQQALAAELRAYEEANKKLEAARKQRESVAKEFAQLSKDMRAPAKNEPASLSDVYDLKAGARQSLKRGDNAEALRQAQQAAKVLRELKDAGENGYGLAGLADELGKIANTAATNIEGNEKAKVDAIKAAMDDLIQKAEAIKRINIEFTGYEQSAAALEQQAIALADRLKKYMVIPVNYVGTDPSVQANNAAAEKIINQLPPSTNRAAGGWVDGPGTPTSDSILLRASRNEFVLQARAAQNIGASALEHMNRTGELPAGRSDLVPYIPQMPALDRVGERQPLSLAMPWGGSYQVDATPAEATRMQNDLKKVALKLGRTS